MPVFACGAASLPSKMATSPGRSTGSTTDPSSSAQQAAAAADVPDACDDDPHGPDPDGTSYAGSDEKLHEHSLPG